MLFQRRWPDALRERGRTMFTAGASLALVARELGVPLRTVRHWAATEGWERADETEASDEKPPAPKPPARQRRAGLKERKQLFDRTWALVLQQHETVLALPRATPLELARFETGMRRLTLLVALLAKLAPLLRDAAPPKRVKEVRPDVPHPVEPSGALLEAVARRFEAFDAAERVAGAPQDAESRRRAGVS